MKSNMKLLRALFRCGHHDRLTQAENSVVTKLAEGCGIRRTYIGCMVTLNGALVRTQSRHSHAMHLTPQI